MSELRKIKVSDAHPHPDNRRISGLDEGIITAVASTLSVDGDFVDATRMPKVRPVDGHYQIICGHHRIEGAKRAGLTEVTVVIEDMDDETAVCEMIISNNANPSDPLDIGFGLIGLKGSPGRGREGGLREIARRTGISRRWLGELARAAEVIPQNGRLSGHFRGLSKHLYAVSTAHPAAHQSLVEWVVSDRPTVKDVEAKVKALAEALNSIPERWADYLPTEQIVPQLVAGRGGKSRKAIVDLMAAAERLLETAEEYDALTAANATASRRDAERKWLIDNVGGDSWDMRHLDARQTKLQLLIGEILRKRPLVHGADALDYLRVIEDASVDLLLTDPPYMTDVEDIAAFVEAWLPLALSKVKPTGRAYICTGSYPLELMVYAKTLLAMDGWEIDGPLVWCYTNTLGPAPTMGYKRNWQAIWHCYRKDTAPLQCPVLTEQFTVQQIAAPGSATEPRRHPWEKPEELARRLVRHGSSVGDVVLDPFAGTGTFLIAAVALDRVAIGCELEGEMLEICKARGCEVVDAEHLT